MSWLQAIKWPEGWKKVFAWTGCHVWFKVDTERGWHAIADDAFNQPNPEKAVYVTTAQLRAMLHQAEKAEMQVGK